MPNELENTLKTVATRVMQYVENAAEMRVETRFVLIDDAGAGMTINVSAQADLDRIRQESKLAALTIAKLDGDSITVIPLRKRDNVLEVDSGVLEQHQQHVDAATAYRARILNSVLDLLRSRGRQL